MSASVVTTITIIALLPGLLWGQSSPPDGTAAGPTSTDDNTSPSPPPSRTNNPPTTPIAGVTRAKNAPACVDLPIARTELEKGFTYQEAGLDWDNATWACTTGTLQSPINFPSPADMAYGVVTHDRAASFNMGQASSAQVRTTATYRVQVEAAWHGSNFSVPVCGGNVGCLNQNQSVPAQFYYANIQRITFHVPSDHTIYGVQYPLEAQIISAIPQDQLAACPAEGCQVGTSVMFALEDDPTLINAFLDSAIPYIPYNGAGCHGFPDNTTLDLDDALPANQSYFTYRGSFTAPPCTEGLTWYVMTNPVQAGIQQVVAVQNAMAQVQRPCGEGRVAKRKKAPSSAADSGRRLLEQGASQCLVSGTRSNNRPGQLLGTRVINTYTDMTNVTAAAR